jgi:hypothetical protein
MRIRTSQVLGKDRQMLHAIFLASCPKTVGPDNNRNDTASAATLYIVYPSSGWREPMLRPVQFPVISPI